MATLVMGASTLVNNNVQFATFNNADLTGSNPNDVTGNGNNMTNIGATTGAVGIIDEAFDFDGINDYVALGTPVNPTASTNMTISFWIKTTQDCSAQECYLVHNDIVGSPDFGIVIADAGLGGANKILFGSNNLASNIISSGVINDDNWYHVVATKELTNGSLWINGVYQGSFTQAGDWENNNAWQMATFRLGAGYWYDGILDSFGVWDRKLTDDEITELYNSGAGNEYPYEVLTITTDVKDFYNTSNITIQVNTSINASTYYFLNDSNKIISEGLITYYPFDGNYSDFSGNGNHGTNNGSTLNNNSINSNYLLNAEFNGVDNTISAVSPLVNANSSSSISAWIYLQPNNPSWQRIITKIYGSNIGARAGSIDIFSNTNKLRYVIVSDTGTDYSATSTTVLNNNQWYYVVGTYDNTTGNVSIYINGNFENSIINTEKTTTSGSSPFYIGSELNTGTPTYFNGSLDEVRIYNRALSESEIELLYNESPYNLVCNNCNTSNLQLYNLDEKNYNISFVSVLNSNVERLEQTFNIDLTNPTITNNLPTEINSYFLNISQYVTCSDPNLLSCNITFTPDNKESPVTNESYEFTYNGNQSYTITAIDNAGNRATDTGVVLINPYANFKFNNTLTGNLVTDFTFGNYSSNNTYVKIPIYDLGLGEHTLAFKKFGFQNAQFSFNFTNTSRINQTYNVSPTTLTVKMFDASDITTQLRFNLTIQNSTNSQVYLNQMNFSKSYNETVTGDITLFISSNNYQDATFFNTLNNDTSISITGYLFPINDSNTQVVQFFTRETGTDANLDGVLIEAQQLINGSFVTITQATTDDSGATFMWLDISKSFKFIFSKTGYVTATSNSIPGVTSYTIKMQSDVDAREYIDGVNVMFLPSLTTLDDQTNQTFKTFITGPSISLMTYELIDQNGTVVYTSTSTNPTGTTFQVSLNVTPYDTLTQKITYVVDGTTNVKQRVYEIININSTNFLNYLRAFNVTTDVGTQIFIWLVLVITLGGAFLVGAKVGSPSLFVIATAGFWAYVDWIPLPYFGVITFTAIIFWMAFGGTK